MSDHPAKLAHADDEDLDAYVDYLQRQAEAWCQNPPEAPEGFVRIPCDADPPHWPTYTVADSDFYMPPNCLHCQYQALMERHAPCEHSRHWPWRRWAVTRWLLRRAYSIGLTAGHGYVWNGHCDGCVTGIRVRGKRNYILGVSRETWACLRAGHKRRKDEYGLCTRCFPPTEAAS